jgi:glycosyltransferase involved in cell wall biosynthesis
VHARIQYVPTQLSLAPWLAGSDIYINPPRIGGGATVAMAMEQGLPVLTLTGSDGADKVGPWAVASLNAYFAQLANWVGDAAARQRAGAALKARFFERLDVSSAAAQDKLLQACDSAVAAFNLRRANSHG